MNTPDPQEIEVAGKVITLTRQIESRLVALGASGNGLREKSESLAGRFPPEVEKLLAFIGCIRNRIAHEDQAGISPEELQFFEEAVAAVLAELKLPGETTAEPSGTPAATLPPPPPAPSPAPVSPPESTGSATLEKPSARTNSYEGWFRSAERLPLAFFLIPGANLLWVLRELLRLTGWFRLAAAFTILAVWVVAIFLAFRREFSAAGILAMLSYAVSFAATLCPAETGKPAVEKETPQ